MVPVYDMSRCQQWRENLNLTCEGKKVLVILRTAGVDVLQMAKALLLMSEKENQPVKMLYLM